MYLWTVMIKAVVFDMGGVVLPLDVQRGIINFKERAGFMDIENYLDPCHQKGFIKDLEEGRIDEDEFYREALLHCNSSATQEMIEECFNSLILGVNPDALRLFSELKGKYRLYVLSNNNPISMRAFRKLLAQSGMVMEDIFTDMFFSFKLKMLKPSTQIYEAMIKGTGVLPEEILFIDDSPLNIEFAARQGVRTLTYVTSENNLYERVMQALG